SVLKLKNPGTTAIGRMIRPCSRNFFSGHPRRGWFFGFSKMNLFEAQIVTMETRERGERT
ncbi:hypothetical protein, partial [Paenibacillus rigui]|uniref:hypothetical protein n=1 Tax=Paenibacillus rigui TaxID=554312 RepID=UPI001C528C38